MAATMTSCLLTAAILLPLLAVSQGAVIRTIVDEEIPKTSDLTCWTCPNKTNNTECNNWAPDVKCALNNTACKSVHRVNLTSGLSLSVVKQCTTLDQCSPDQIGCSRNFTSNVMECVSCCTQNYCNEQVPVNQTHALALSAALISNSATASHAASLSLLILILAAFISSLLVQTTRS